MKKSLVVFSFAILICVPAAWAKVRPVPTLSPSLAHNVDFRMRQDLIQIQQDLRSGKLSKAQADSLKAKVLAIRKEELADRKANEGPSTGSGQGKSLTDAQKAQLNAELDAIQPSI